MCACSGQVALIGVNSAVVTPPMMAWGEVGAAQRERLGRLLDQLGQARAVPPGADPSSAAAGPGQAARGLRDAAALEEVLRTARRRTRHPRPQPPQLAGVARTRPAGRLPVVGAPSASLGAAAQARAAGALQSLPHRGAALAHRADRPRAGGARRRDRGAGAAHALPCMSRPHGMPEKSSACRENVAPRGFACHLQLYCAQRSERNRDKCRKPSPPAPRVARPLWVVVLSAGLIVGIAMGLRQVMGLYLPPMTKELGIGREPFSTAMAVANLVWGLGAVFAGMIADRYGAGRVVVTRRARHDDRHVSDVRRPVGLRPADQRRAAWASASPAPASPRWSARSAAPRRPSSAPRHRLARHGRRHRRVRGVSLHAPADRVLSAGRPAC